MSWFTGLYRGPDMVQSYHCFIAVNLLLITLQFSGIECHGNIGPLPRECGCRVIPKNVTRKL